MEILASRSAPVDAPKESSRWTTSSVATLPVAPGEEFQSPTPSGRCRPRAQSYAVRMLSKAPYRIVQWTTGNVGKSSVQAITANPTLELVGCYAWSPEKVGRDVGELCGIGPLGVTATDDIDALLSEQRVRSQLEPVAQMRFEIELPPDPPDRGPAQPTALCHRGQRPVRGVLRSLLQGGGDDLLHLVQQDRRSR